MADVPLFPVTVVGSWPRPPELIQALRRRQADEISEDEFNAVADKAVVQALKEQERPAPTSSATASSGGTTSIPTSSAKSPGCS